jgi:hypothetical protein
MTGRKTQNVRRQLRTLFKRDFFAFLKTLTPTDLEIIFARAEANRLAQAGRALTRQEG